MNNPGYDFICNKGYKVDVKCSVWHDDYGRYWFNIYKNKIPDYYVFLAFNNREELKPEHLWLVPGDVVNNVDGVGIHSSTLRKWFKYEQPIDRIVECCDKMKSRGIQ
jgi:hypothetical protein